jgi:hypothetical protein
MAAVSLGGASVCERQRAKIVAAVLLDRDGSS